LKYKKAIYLATVGENYWLFRNDLRENGIHLSQVMSKVQFLEKVVVESDPMIWDRLKSLSVREFQNYVRKKRDGINVYSDSSNGREFSVDFSISGASLSICNMKVRGLN